MKTRSEPLHWFAVMWDCNGLEAIARVPNPADHTFAVLANLPLPEMPHLNHWRLRAQFNPQRHYEIYLVSAEDGIDVDEIKLMFDADPQSAADTIRQYGHQFYSDRASQKRPAII